MKNVITAVTALAMVSMSAGPVRGDVHGEKCGDGIDWRAELEGKGYTMGFRGDRSYGPEEYVRNGQTFGSVRDKPCPFTVDRRPAGFPGAMMDPYLEHGDAMYNRLNMDVVSDYHAALFNEMVYTLVDGKLMVDGFSEESNRDDEGPAQESKTVLTASQGISLTLPSDELVGAFQFAQWKYATMWGRNYGRGWRGSRTPNYRVLSLQDRRNVVAVGRDLTSTGRIGYCLTNMVDLRNVWEGWGFATTWRGTIEYIDEIRCDGVVEFAYEENDIKAWGEGDPANTAAVWNLGNSGNATYDAHNDMWDLAGYNAGEVSPMIQAGCGGYGTGTRSTFRSHPYHKPPSLSLGIGYREIYAGIYDAESDQVYYMLQERSMPSGGWNNLIGWRRAVTSNGYTAAAAGWAVTWSRWEHNHRDIDMVARGSDQSYYRSAGYSDFEFIRTHNKPLAELTIVDFDRGGSGGDKNEAKNVCHLWQVGGF